MNLLITLYLSLVGALFGGALLIHFIPRLGKVGKQVSDALCHAPGIDLALAYFTIAPFIFGAILAGWSGTGIALLAELTTLWLWIVFHELINYQRWSEPKIHRTMSRLFGSWRNHLALWITLLALPGFWIVRLNQIIAYPPLTWLIKFPKYNAKDWVNVSRQKFVGLIGYDLIWCLYCDWMTGVWSLGTEMLRNVESFWCPIRFYSDKKCENCKIDFPDLDQGWVSTDGDMKEVVQLLEKKYVPTQESAWYGHPCRQLQKEELDVTEKSDKLLPS